MDACVIQPWHPRCASANLGHLCMAVHVCGGGRAKVWEAVVGGGRIIVHLQDISGVNYTMPSSAVPLSETAPSAHAHI